MPVANAEITITSNFETYEAYTDSTGNFEILVTPSENGEYITVEAYHPENEIQYPESVEVWVGGTELDPKQVNFWLLDPEEAGSQGVPGSQGQQSDPLNE